MSRASWYAGGAVTTGGAEGGAVGVISMPVLLVRSANAKSKFLFSLYGGLMAVNRSDVLYDRIISHCVEWRSVALAGSH